MERYLNRRDAGKKLTSYLKHYAGRQDVIVLALPRGGVPVAYEIAKALQVPMDVFIVRKLGVPGHSELAMGAIATGGAQVFNEEIIRDLSIPQSALEYVIQSEEKELARREAAYRENKPFPSLKHKTVILVDDGVATGASIRAAIKSLRQLGAEQIIAAIPVADPGMCTKLSKEVDELICPLRPAPFYAVGGWYEDFSQTEDEEVHALLKDSSEQL